MNSCLACFSLGLKNRMAAFNQACFSLGLKNRMAVFDQEDPAVERLHDETSRRFITATMGISEMAPRVPAGQFRGPRAIVVAANRSATWPDPDASSHSGFPPLPFAVSFSPFHPRKIIAMPRTPEKKSDGQKRLSFALQFTELSLQHVLMVSKGNTVLKI